MSKIYTTSPLSAEQQDSLAKLKPGQKIRLTHIVRVGLTSWPVVVTGTFRHVDSLATGLATQRVPEDDIVVALVHFTKDNGELSSVALDEHSKIEVLTSSTV